MVLHKGIHAETAAKWTSLFYLGITVGRFLSGFITGKIGDKNMVRMGQITAGLGIVFILLPLANRSILIGLILVGLGCAPIYPSLLHETPDNFGTEKSQSIMGMQMAYAYIGTTFMSPAFGFLAEKISISLYPFYLMFFMGLMVVMVEMMNRIREKKI